MARISKSTKKEINITKEPEGKAKVNKGEYNNLLHKFKCKGCGVSFDTKMDLIQHNRQEHKLNLCIICKAQKWGDNRLNDHTKKCREERDKKRADNDKKETARAKTNQKKTTNIYTILMEEGAKNQEKNWRK